MAAMLVGGRGAHYANRVNNFEHHIAQLVAQGFSVERGMLTGAFESPDQIGVRFTAVAAGVHTQIDSYLQSAFFEANKSHVKLGETQEIVGPQGVYKVAQILG